MNQFKWIRGVSLLEVLMVSAVVALLLGMTLPEPKSVAIRANVSHSLEIVAFAQQALVKTCKSDSQAVVKTNLDAGFFYIPAGTEEDHVSQILLGADCAQKDMVIVLWTSNTGAETDPVIELMAQTWLDQGNGESVGNDLAWACRVIKGDVRHVPEGCQGLSVRG